MGAERASAELLRRPLDALEARLGETLGLALRECAPEGVLPRLRHRIQDRALDGPEAYAEYLLYSGDRAAWEDLAETLTANESRVFGSPGDFTPLLEMAADPDSRRTLPLGGPFRCLSAGCGTGEEAYSLAVVLAEVRSRSPSFEFEVIGADLSARAVARARRGVYPASRAESIPSELRERYFLERGGEIVAGALRPYVRFARLNLCDPGSLLPMGLFHLVLARGFLPTLTADGSRTALGNLVKALAPGGVLLLGAEDSIGDLDLGITPIRWGDRFAYERTDPDQGGAPRKGSSETRDPGLALIAHRSAVTRAWIRILLEQHGLRVEEAPHGIRVLERAALGGPPSLYVLERTLPPRGAGWVVERLRSMGLDRPGSVVTLSPGRPDASGPETLPLPLTRRDLDSVLARAAL
ncbi:MAG TPA: CheR family methyltransferase [Candidatus Binatia bacterium]|nr:CheR family methyltransferase [Candidatus Binatia bacterium]